MSPGAVDRGARRADAAVARRPLDGRDRAGLSRTRVDRRATDRPCQTNPDRGARPVRGAGGKRSRGSSRVGARGDLSRIQRGLLRDRGRRLDATALCLDALRLGRLVAEPLPREPEAHGLVALMEIQASRTKARVGPAGEPILLLDQNRGQWDQLLIRRGLAALERAEALGGALGPYALQAAIAACHARARTGEETDWAQIAALYDALAQLAHSPVVELNRAVAYGMAFGPAAGLELADALVSEPALKSYHLLPSVRGDLLAKLGRPDEARSEFERAAALTRNARERDLLLERAAACSRS